MHKTVLTTNDCPAQNDSSAEVEKFFSRWWAYGIVQLFIFFFFCLPVFSTFSTMSMQVTCSSFLKQIKWILLKMICCKCLLFLLPNNSCESTYHSASGFLTTTVPFSKPTPLNWDEEWETRYPRNSTWFSLTLTVLLVVLSVGPTTLGSVVS